MQIQKNVERELERLGNNSRSGVKPLNSKVQAETDSSEAKIMRDFRSFLGAVNQMNKVNSNLDNLCYPVKTLSKIENQWNSMPKYNNPFNQLIEKMNER